MKHLLLAVILFITGCDVCGPTFIEAPRAVDVTDCVQFTKRFSTTAAGSGIPLPFAGSRSVVLKTSKPERWDEYSGTLHLVGISWDITWISSLKISVGGITIAVWEDEQWHVGSTSLDLFDHISETSDGRLQIKPMFRARGVKPGKETEIKTNIVLAACGADADKIFYDLTISQRTGDKMNASGKVLEPKPDFEEKLEELLSLFLTYLQIDLTMTCTVYSYGVRQPMSAEVRLTQLYVEYSYDWGKNGGKIEQYYPLDTTPEALTHTIMSKILDDRLRAAERCYHG
jgi:hypothetical protein